MQSIARGAIIRGSGISVYTEPGTPARISAQVIAVTQIIDMLPLRRSPLRRSALIDYVLKEALLGLWSIRVAMDHSLAQAPLAQADRQSTFN